MEATVRLHSIPGIFTSICMNQARPMNVLGSILHYSALEVPDGFRLAVLYGIQIRHLDYTRLECPLKRPSTVNLNYRNKLVTFVLKPTLVKTRANVN